ncbi:MAG: ComEA family DNA-binding protein [Acidimicrobiales bacterium]
MAQFRQRLASLPPGAVLGSVALAVAVVIGLVLLTRRSAPPPALALPRAMPGGTSAGAPPPPPSEAQASATVTVHAAGAVVRPGVYAVPAGARVADVVVAAGGARPDADVDQLNLAAKVADAQRVYVPRKGEAVAPVVEPGAAGPGGSPSTPGSPVDLNTATPPQLDALPGIGPALAAAIVEYRTKNGPFRSVTGLLDVPGIGPAKLDAIRALVRAGSSSP